MVAIVEDKRMALAELCHRYGVERLYLFGSGATGRFDTHRSDLDFLVCFANRETDRRVCRPVLDLRTIWNGSSAGR
jgi:predicted nucleotidyltransferase